MSGFDGVDDEPPPELEQPAPTAAATNTAHVHRRESPLELHDHPLFMGRH
jgi:hypothetical protein